MSARTATRSAGLALALMLISVYLAACRGKATPEGATPQPETVLTAAAMTANAQISLTAQASATNTPQPTPTQQATVAVTPSPALTQPGLTPTALSTAGPGGSDLAAYASDVTIPDGTNMEPGEAFLKTWRLSNIGTSTWTTQYALTFVEGEQMSGPASVPLTTNVPPGGAVDISVNLVAPQATGTHRGYWQMRNANGQLFITAIWVEITVGGADGSPTDEGGTTQTPAPGGSGEVSDVSLEVDDASASGCPHTFALTGSLTLSQAANVTYQLEAESDDPGFELDLPEPVTANLAAGVHQFSYTLDISDAFSGWAQFHVTSPEDVLSDPVSLTVECD